MSELKNILLLDADGNAVDNIVIPARAVTAIALDTMDGYIGPLWIGAQWDGEKLIDPNPAPVVTEAQVVPSLDGGPDVVA